MLPRSFLNLLDHIPATLLIHLLLFVCFLYPCSFLNLLDRIPAMRSPPRFLLLENVVGFEASDMQQLLMQCLAGAGYHAAEFMLTPLQYAIPYSRPRCDDAAPGSSGTLSCMQSFTWLRRCSTRCRHPIKQAQVRVA